MGKQESRLLKAAALIIMLAFGGCKTGISPQCKFTDFTRKQDLSKIQFAVEVRDARPDTKRYWLDWKLMKAWEEGGRHFNQHQQYFLSKPSTTLLKEGLASSFSQYGYNVSDGAPVSIDCDLLNFLYSYSTDYTGTFVYANIETDVSIKKGDTLLVKKSFKKGVRQPMNVFRQYEDSEPLLSQCLTEIVREIVLDVQLENQLREVYGLPGTSRLAETDKKPNQEKHRVVGTGTGFAISVNGYIVTAQHVVEDAIYVQVKFPSEEWLNAKVVQKSITNDVAILKVDRNTEDFLTIVDSVRQGDKIFTLGYPAPGFLGEEPKYAEGNVSSLTGYVDEASLMQVSVPIQPGNSGGPLLNKDGKVIGMATSVARVESFYEETGTLPQNVNWGVKAAFIRPLLPAECANSEVAKQRAETEPIETVVKAVCLIKVEKEE